MKTKKLTISAMFIAIGVLCGNIIYIPIGASKCFPIQHTINIISAVMLGPFYAVLNAFAISLLRNFMGTGSILAFGGSMIGAFLSGIFYKYSKNNILAIIGEVFGTGIIGGTISIPIAKFLMGSGSLSFFVYIVPFTLSSLSGGIIAYIILKSKDLVKLMCKF